MEELLALADGLPRRSLARGEVLLVDGEPVQALYVLLSGALRIEKGGSLIAIVAERGTCVGEMSLLLDNPATADVVAEADASWRWPRMRAPRSTTRPASRSRSPGSSPRASR